MAPEMIRRGRIGVLGLLGEHAKSRDRRADLGEEQGTQCLCMGVGDASQERVRRQGTDQEGTVIRDGPRQLPGKEPHPVFRSRDPREPLDGQQPVVPIIGGPGVRFQGLLEG